MTPDNDIFADDPLALEICVTAERAQLPLSAYELGKETGRPQASLERPLKELTAAGVLHEGSRPRGRGSVKVFSFDERWSEAVWSAVRSRTVGLLKPGGRIILIDSGGVEAAARLLRDERFSPYIAWVCEFDDSTFGVAIGLRDDIEPSVVAALLPELRRLGGRPEAALKLSVARTFDQPEAKEWTREVLEGTSALPLQPGA